MTRTTFDATKVFDMQKALEAAPPAPKRMSKADVLRSLEPTLRDLREKKNYTLEQLAVVLKDLGVEVKVSTIQGALKRKGTGKKRAKPAPAPAASGGGVAVVVVGKEKGNKHAA